MNYNGSERQNQDSLHKEGLQGVQAFSQWATRFSVSKNYVRKKEGLHTVGEKLG